MHEVLEPGERLTLIMLFAIAEPDDLVAWVSTREMADNSGYTMRTMQDHIRKLVELDLVVAVRRKDPRSLAFFRGFALSFSLDGTPREIPAELDD